MKKNLLYNSWNRIISALMLLIIILIFTQCDRTLSLYLINNSNNTVTIKSKKSQDYLQQAPIKNYMQRRLDIESKLSDSSFLPKLQIDFFQIIYDTKSSIKIYGDTISFELKPRDSLRIGKVSHLFFPERINEPSLQFDNLLVITNSDTFFLRSRKEILSQKSTKGLRMKETIEWK